ncbi:MAG: DinB family protein [Streptosporangiaceae bacterium]
MATPSGLTSFEVTAEPLKVQFETFLDEHRAALRACLDGLTEEQARRRLVRSQTTLLGLVKHASYAEQVWFGEAVTGRPRQDMGLPPSAADAFILTPRDSIESVRRGHERVCQASRRATASLGLDDVLRGHRLGPLPLRWVYLHALREFAQHCGHADILREQILSPGIGS